MSFDLTGFKPEALEEDKGFEPFSGKYEVVVDSVVIEDVAAGADYEAYKRNKVKVSVVKAYEEKNSKNVGRVLFASTNLSNENSVKKLASVYASVGVIFTNMESLDKANKEIVGKTLTMSCWVDKRDPNNLRQSSKFVKSDILDVAKASTPF